MNEFLIISDKFAKLLNDFVKDLTGFWGFGVLGFWDLGI